MKKRIEKTKTHIQHLRSSVVSNLIELADKEIEDIESGIEEGLYEKDMANMDRLDELKMMIEDAKQLRDYVPSIFVIVEGGNIQGASATEPITFNLWDYDNHKADPDEYEKNNGTEEQWNRNIANLTSIY